MYLGATLDVNYEKSKHRVGNQTKLYAFSDGVYEDEKSDGSMWQFDEFAEFISNIKTFSQSRLDRLHRHAENIRSQDNFKDDFAILEVAFG
jgi:sigma-B regulation protein RsbU (phosphoserine phosphatase)